VAGAAAAVLVALACWALGAPWTAALPLAVLAAVLLGAVVHVAVSVRAQSRVLRRMAARVDSLHADRKDAAAGRAVIARLSMAMDSGLLTRADVPTVAGSVASSVAASVVAEEELGQGRVRRLLAEELRGGTLAPAAAVEVREPLPRLGWSVKVATPRGPRAQNWGDTHFAGSLAAALRRLGQDVRVDFKQEHGEQRDEDVVLVLRGLEAVVPTAATVNLLWVISHPDDVTAEELAAYDVVHVASRSWRPPTDRPVVPLLQCSDTTVFRPDPLGFDTGPQALFVGNRRGGDRPVVDAMVAEGLPMTVIGSGWADRLPPGTVAREYVPNVSLSPLYSAAGVVLNDHWEDMRIGGFVSNRLFDAACAGARVVSDHVDGVEELFGGLVQVFSSPEDLRRLVQERETVFPPAVERLRIAAEVAAHHSFDARARQLAEEAARQHAARASR
jgi:glycosyltransferase involved in cell wall biosynthesis